MLIRNNFSLQDERGAALLLTIILLTVFSLLTVVLFELLQTSTQISGNQRLDLRATYITDAGIEEGINELRAKPGFYYTDSDIPVLHELLDIDGGPDGNDKTFHLGGGTYEVTLESIKSSNPASIFFEANITSKSDLLKQKRAIKAHVEIIPISAPDVFAVSTTSWELWYPEE